MARGNYLGPLHGILVAVKDQLYTKGVPTTLGSPLFKDFIPDDMPL
jgi:Asp-tRNA(Asn)/Glu-tRNA(Gln) amidotransferase A subunit family amidase